MSDMSELKRLEADLKESEDLSKRLDEAIRRIAEEGKAASDGELMVAAASELGYDIGVADLERARAEAEDVDDAELESVSGGMGSEYLRDEYGHDWICVVAWHCLATMLHTETKSQVVQCWSDYACAIFNN